MSPFTVFFGRSPCLGSIPAPDKLLKQQKLVIVEPGRRSSPQPADQIVIGNVAAVDHRSAIHGTKQLQTHKATSTRPSQEKIIFGGTVH
jgi:hypothetical protein